MGDELPVNYKLRLSGLVRQHADVRPMVWENDRKLIVLIVLGAVMQDGEAPVVLIVHLVRKVRTVRDGAIEIGSLSRPPSISKRTYGKLGRNRHFTW